MSGYSWGLAEYKRPEWADEVGETTYGRIGEAIGSTVSLFTPWGPFNMLGRGLGRATSVFAKEGSRRIAREAAENVSKRAVGQTAVKDTPQILNAVRRLAKEKNITISEAKSLLRKDIGRGLQETTESSDNLKYLLKHQLGEELAEDASVMILGNSRVAIKNAFKKSGIKQIPDHEIDFMARTFTNEIKKGKHINEMSHWLENSLKTRFPDTLKPWMSKYLGMAAQDAVMMGVHGMAVGAVTSDARNQPFDAGGAFWHAMAASAIFPGIRAIGSGKGENLKVGLDALRRRYSNTNYNKMWDLDGGRTTRELLGVMTRGAKLDVVNASRFGDAVWSKGLSRTYKGKEDIIGRLYDMPKKDVIGLMENFKLAASKELSRKWTTNYVKDFIKPATITRMVLGAGAMNYTPFAEGHFEHMDSEEVWTHLLIAAAMTKSRGGWGREEGLINHFTDYDPYYRALDLLGVSADKVKDVVRSYEHLEGVARYGASLYSNQLGQKIYGEVSKYTGKSTGTAQSNLPIESSKMQGIAKIHDIMAMHLNKGNPTDIEPMSKKLQYLSKKDINQLKKGLENIKLEDGRSILELNETALLEHLTQTTGDQLTKLYADMLLATAEHGMPIGGKYERDIAKLMISEVRSAEGQDMGHVAELMNIARLFERHNIADIVDTPLLTKGERRYTNIKDINQEGLFRVIERYKKIIQESMGGGDMNFRIDDNEFLGLIQAASNGRAKNRIFDIMLKTTTEKDDNLISNINTLFQRQGKYFRSIDDYKIILDQSKFNKDADGKIMSDSKKLELRDQLESIFNLSKFPEPTRSLREGEPKSEIKESDANQVIGEFANIFSQLPTGMQRRFMTEGMDYFTMRYLEGRNYDPRSIVAIKEILDHNMGRIESDLRLKVQDPEMIFKQFESEGMNIDQLKDLRYKWQSIINIVGKDNIRTERIVYQTETDPRYIDVEPLDINIIYNNITNKRYQTFKHSIKDKLEELSKDFGEDGNLLRDAVKTVADIGGELQRGKDPVSKVDNLLETITAMENKYLKKYTGVSLKEMSAPEFEVRNILKNIKSDLAKLSSKIKGLGSMEGDKLESLISKDGEIMSIGEGIHKLLSLENEAKFRMSGIVTDIRNAMVNGEMTKESSMRLIDDLTVKLTKEMDADLSRGMEFDQVLETYNKTRLWTDAYKVFEEMQNRVVSLRKDSQSEPVHQRYENIEENREKYDRISHSSESPLAIAQRFNLVEPSNPNEISRSFIERLKEDKPDNVNKAIDDIKIHFRNDPDNPRTLRSKEFNEFMSGDGQVLINHVLSQVARPTAEIVDGVMTVDNSKPGRYNKNYEFYQRKHDGNGSKPFRIVKLNTKLTVRENGVLRSRDIEELNYKEIQRLIDESIPYNKEMLDHFAEIRQTGKEIEDRSLRDLFKESGIEHPYLYMRISPSEKILFEASKENIDKLNLDYNNFYKKTLSEYKKINSELAEQFETTFSGLIDASHSPKILELKLLANHMGSVNKFGFKGWLETLISAGSNQDAISTLESNLYKRGFITDGGDTRIIHKNWNDWVSRHSNDPDLVKLATDLSKNPKNITTSIVKDENPDINNPFNIKQSNIRQLDQRHNVQGISDFHKTMMLSNINEKQFIESTNTSSIDGAMYPSKVLAKYLWLAQGKDIGEFNALKPYIFSNTMLGKGLIIYDPQVASKMNTHLLMGESAAKMFGGKSLTGAEVSGADILTGSNNWLSSVNGISKGNQMKISYSDIGLKYMGKESKGVVISNSMADLEGPSYIKALKKWQRIDIKLDETMQFERDLIHNDAFLSNLYQQKADQGFVYTEGSYGLSATYVDPVNGFGLQARNPLVTPTLFRMGRNKTLQDLRRSISKYGTDAYIIPEVNGELRIPTFLTLENTVGRDVRQTRTITQYGEAAMPHSMGQVKGSIDRYTFIYRDPNGIDMLVNFTPDKKGKLHFEYYSPYYDNNLKGPKGLFPKVKVINELGVEQDLGIGGYGGNPKIPDRTPIVFKKRVESLLKELNSLAGNNLSMKAVWQLFRNGQIGSGNNLIKLNQKNYNTAKLIDLALAAPGNAIPLKGYDKGIHRVSNKPNLGFMSREYGATTKINSYDVRVMHQRDFDADHFYWSMDKPFSMIKVDSQKSGLVRDLYPYEKEAPNINAFGIVNDNGKWIAGGSPTTVGFHNYGAELVGQQRILGQVIGYRNALTWLRNLGFNTVGGKDLLRTDPISEIKELNKMDNINSEEFGILSRMLDASQSGLDYHQGTAPVLKKNQIAKYFLLGETPFVDKKDGSHMNSKSNRASVFHGLGTGKVFNDKAIEWDVITTLLRTIKRANVVSNDIYDEFGSRTPENHELRTIYYDLRSLFSNPDVFLLNKMTQMPKYRKNLSEMKKLIRGFYGDEYMNPKNLDEYAFKAMKGNIIPPSKLKFQFNKKLNIDDMFEMHQGGGILKRLVTEKSFFDDMFPADLGPNRHALLGDEVNNILNRVAMAKSFW